MIVPYFAAMTQPLLLFGFDFDQSEGISSSLLLNINLKNGSTLVPSWKFSIKVLHQSGFE